MTAALVWFRDDLRLDDQPALRAALERGWLPVPVYIHAPDEEGAWAPGAASDAWRLRSLAALAAELERRGSRLLVLRGPTLGTLQALAALTGADAVLWTRRYEPAVEQRDAKIKRALRQAGLHAESFNGALLFGLARAAGYKLAQSLGLASAFSDLFMIFPYILTLLLLMFFSKTNRAPRALGEIYDKGKR